MKRPILGNLRTRLSKLLLSLGAFLEHPAQEGEKKNRIFFPLLHSKFAKQKSSKEVYGHKRKGSVNTDASLFNRPRKDVGAGRTH